MISPFFMIEFDNDIISVNKLNYLLKNHLILFMVNMSVLKKKNLLIYDSICVITLFIKHFMILSLARCTLFINRPFHYMIFVIEYIIS
jgi:hypothetical protein